MLLTSIMVTLMQPRIFVLLRRCLFDSDDEVSSFLMHLSLVYTNSLEEIMSMLSGHRIYLPEIFDILHKPICKILLAAHIICYQLQVRDRATLYLNTLGADGAVADTGEDANGFLFGLLDIPLVNLETSLKNYVSLYF